MMISERPKSNIFMLRKQTSDVSVSSSKTFNSSAFPTTPSLLSSSLMEQNIRNAESLITKWDPNSSHYTKLIFLFQTNRNEAKDFLNSVDNLRRAMHFLVTHHSNSESLSLAQKLMQVAMKTLEKEFYQILTANRNHLDPESVSSRSSRGSSSFSGDEDEIRPEDDLQFTDKSMSDLKSIADCMISSGYGKECVKIYKIIRKSIIDEGLYRLGTEKYFKSSQVQKMNWEEIEHVSKKWMEGVKIAVRTVFRGERILCDHVFSGSNTIRESCFYEITKEGANNLFKFPELIAKGIKKDTERIFILMELYQSVSDLRPDIDSLFSFQSTSSIKMQADSSLLKLRHSVRAILGDFESRIQIDSSKTPVFGGGIHPLTRWGMTFVAALAEYSDVLSCIIDDYPQSRNSSIPESYFANLSPDDSTTPVATVQFAWLVLVLLCKLDSKAEIYKDVSLSYLFLTNNLHYIVDKVSASSLKPLLGDLWISDHTKKIKQYASNYVTTAWTKVLASLQEKGGAGAAISTQTVKDSFKKFNAAFEGAYRKQTSWIVHDGKLRDELKVSIANKLLPAYREFYDTYLMMVRGDKNLEMLVRFSPDDLGNYLSDLFHGTSSSSSGSFTSSSLNSRGCLPSLHSH